MSPASTGSDQFLRRELRRQRATEHVQQVVLPQFQLDGNAAQGLGQTIEQRRLEATVAGARAEGQTARVARRDPVDGARLAQVERAAVGGARRARSSRVYLICSPMLRATLRSTVSRQVGSVRNAYFAKSSRSVPMISISPWRRRRSIRWAVLLDVFRHAADEEVGPQLVQQPSLQASSTAAGCWMTLPAATRLPIPNKYSRNVTG